MTPEEKSLLERTLKLAQDNNALLRGLRRSNRVSTVMRVFYWLIIIGLSFGAYYFVQPYINELTSLLGGNPTTSAGAPSLVSDQNAVESAASSLQQLLQGKK